MISAKLIKSLEKKGFELEFPSYASHEEEIIDVLRTKNKRLYQIIPPLLQQRINYYYVINKLDKKLKKEFNKIIAITNKIFRSEKIDNKHLKDIIDNYAIQAEMTKTELTYYHSAFKELLKKEVILKEKTLEEQVEMRAKLNMNKSLSNIFSPGKLKIMEKIFNHAPLTNSELKYYYRSIRPLILSLLNEQLRSYVRIIESVKKYHQ